MKTLYVSVVLTILILSPALHANTPQQNICSDVQTIQINRTKESGVPQKLNLYLKEYNVRYQDKIRDNTYCLKFASQNGDIKVPSTINLLFTTKDQYNVYIEGLPLIRDAVQTTDTPLLTIENTQSGTVTLSNSQFTDVKNGIKVVATGKTEIDHVVIKGKINTEGTCLELASSDAMVKTSDISNCQMGISVAGDNSKILGSDIYENSEGIRIAADNTYLGAGLAENFATEANLIHANGTGIHIVSGSSNKFPFNSVYENQTYGILYDEALLPNIPQPILEFPEKDSPDALYCEKDPTDKILSAWLKLKNISNGELEIYKIDASNISQGKSYLTNCQIDNEGKCKIEVSKINDEETKIYELVAIYNGNTSTSAYTNLFLLKCKYPTIIAPTTPDPIDIPAIVNDTGPNNTHDDTSSVDDGLEGINTASLNDTRDSASSIDDELEDIPDTPDDNPINITTVGIGSSSDGSTTGAEAPASPVTSSVASPVAGCSLDPSNTKTGYAEFVIIALLLAVIRLKRKAMIHE